jgi:hypothetical protein
MPAFVPMCIDTRLKAQMPVVKTPVCLKVVGTVVSSPRVAVQGTPQDISKVLTKQKDKTVYKHCAKCQKKHPLSDFPVNGDSSDGRGSYCRKCKSDLSKDRRIKDAGARFTHYIISRLHNEMEKSALPADLETNLEQYLGYRMFELRKHLRIQLKLEGKTLISTFKDGWHLDHVRPFSSFPEHKVGDEIFRECWHYSNLKMIPALENLQKGAKYAAT